VDADRVGKRDLVQLPKIILSQVCDRSG
jgi:hypothetical protein